jgi:long-chain acyl-CoA synthetase
MDPAKVRTLVDLLRARAEETPDRVALQQKKDGAWRDITFRELAARAAETAAALVDLGLAPGDRVAILSENRPEWAFTDFGILSAAAVDVPIYGTNLPKQCEYILQNSGAVGVFVSTSAQLAKILEVLPNCPAVKFVVPFDPVAPDPKQPLVRAYDDFLALGRARLEKEPAVVEKRRDLIKPDDLASLIYTSGTTGDPKGVMLTHGNFVSNVQAVLRAVPIGPDDVFLSFLPLSHSFERTAGYYVAIHGGARIAYAESIDKVRDNLPEVRPTIMCSVPRLYEKMYAGIREKVQKSSLFRRRIGEWAFGVGRAWSEATLAGRAPGPLLSLQRAIAERLVFAKIREILGGNFRFAVSGGAPLAREIALFFHSLGLIILEGYGLTETSPVISCNRLDALRPGTVGKPVEQVEVKIAADGEILVRGPNVMKGYYRNEKATNEVLEPDGWFHTGDVGEFDAQGFLRITDRKKDLMKTSGGKYIAPQPIEGAFKTGRWIAECVVIADDRPYPSALLVPKFDALEPWAREQGLSFRDRAELVKLPQVDEVIRGEVERVNKDLAQYEKIKKWRVLDRELTQEAGELTPTLKVKRKLVYAKFKDLIESMYAEGKEPAEAKRG